MRLAATALSQEVSPQRLFRQWRRGLPAQLFLRELPHRALRLEVVVVPKAWHEGQEVISIANAILRLYLLLYGYQKHVFHVLLC